MSDSAEITEQAMKNIRGSTRYLTWTKSEYPVSGVHSALADLPDEFNAQIFQLNQVGKSFGNFCRQSNSCRTHVEDVIRAGGGNVPTTPYIDLLRWFEEL